MLQKCADLNYEWCWCNCSDWSDEVMEIEPPNQDPTPTTKQNSNLNIDITRHKFGLNTNTTKQPPSGLPHWRKSSSNGNTNNAPLTNAQTTSEKATDTLDIRDIRSISNKGFENM